MSTCTATSIDVALLGCGNVGSALARLAASGATDALLFNITGALVRDVARRRGLPASAQVTADGRALLSAAPDVVVELLGGVEPARTLLVEALGRRIPVVTANKTLLARHGRELREAAAAARTPLLYEAAVLAGVPFLGTFSRRPYAAAASNLTGIVNGTSNFILTRLSSEVGSVQDAVAAAQRRGYAEPDPRSDLSGADAAEKLAVLLQHFAGRDVHPDSLHVTGIDALAPHAPDDAAELGGVVKPVVFADWSGPLEAFVGPAFVPDRHVLARVDGVENALVLGGPRGRLLFQGPGAGPDVTAATVLDDVREIAAGGVPSDRARREPLVGDCAVEPDTSWMITIAGPRLPRASETADLLASYGVYVQRAGARRGADGGERQSFLLWQSARPSLDGALGALRGAADCSTIALRALELAA